MSCVYMWHLEHRLMCSVFPPYCPLSSYSCYNCGGLDHHAKECGLPPQPKKCHYCQSITHMVAQCPHKALAPATGSQDQHASTSAFSPGTGPYLCPPEEEERSGSSPLEGSSSSPEEPHTRGPRTQRWRKSWKQPIEVKPFTANPWPSCLPSIKDTWSPPSSTSHLWKKWEVLIFFTFFKILFRFFFPNQRSYGNDHRGTDVCECVWLTCSHLVQLWQPPLEWWLQGMTVFLVSISAAQEWNNMVWIFFFFLPFSSPLGPKCFSFWILFFLLTVVVKFLSCRSNHSKKNTKRTKKKKRITMHPF